MKCNILLSILFLNIITCAPLNNNNNNNNPEKISRDLEKSLENFLSIYYEKYINAKIAAKEIKSEEYSKKVKKTEENSKGAKKIEENIYDTMQGDQPTEDNMKIVLQNSSNSFNSSTNEYYRTKRIRDKDNWMETLKKNILFQLGRENMTTLQPQGDSGASPLNYTLPTLLNHTFIDEDHIIEKIRSFYPSCDTPQHTDEEAWKDDVNIMNLFFNFDYNNDERNSNIATATLRLYRIPVENNTKTPGKATPDCDTTPNVEEEKLKVSIYWYTKSLKKKKVKRRLADCKMISESAQWVELDVKPATKAWGRGKNFGMTLEVEDQDGNVLRASKYFKGATCTVGASTPKPIPTIIVDAVRKTYELNRINDLHRDNSSRTIYSDLQLLPTIDICTLEFPENYTLPHNWKQSLGDLRINACNLRKMHEQTQKMAEKEQLERLITLQVPNTHHIRHQRQHLAQKQSELNNDDPRSRFVNSRIVLTNEELTNFNLQKFNLSSIRR